ncbi:MAG TPA: hypothetical protein VFN47_05610 [Pedococcus sp.]|nr:hypothetical protein [Pedococcus sp.]
MTWEDLFNLAVLGGAPALLALGAVGILVTPHPRWVSALALVFASVMIVAFAVFWVVWGRAFEYADTYRPVPASLDLAGDIAAIVFAAAYVLFLLTAIAALIKRKRGKVQPTHG